MTNTKVPTRNYKENMILNRTLIESDIHNENERIITLVRKDAKEKETKMSDALLALPPGIIMKHETGMGATTLEIKTKRNSIIVQPIKITASTKAKEHDALYVGSATKLHPTNIDATDIEKYINDSKIEFKKILVVADSLPKVINAIGEKVFSEYFLLIDEIDSFQLDSNFRNRMETCIDYYKKFEPTKRTMVSATTIDFTDPELANEPKTSIKYNVPAVREIAVSYAPINLKAAAYNRIVSIATKEPIDKILVAFNSVIGCYNIANHLVKHSSIPSQDIKILCSVASKEKVGPFYAELDGTTLPGRINFVTSAYFTGYDLKETYHLISVSNSGKVYTLSEKRLKQIAGRCRHNAGLLSETIIYNTTRERQETFDLKTILEAADKEIAALKCIENNFEGHPFLKSMTDTIRNVVADYTALHSYRFVRIKDGKPVISYLNIDAYLENARVENELYKSETDLPKALRLAGHNVYELSISQKAGIEDELTASQSKGEQINSILDRLICLKSFISPLQVLYGGKAVSPLQEEIVLQFHKLHKYIDRERYFELIRKAASSRDQREIDNKYFAAYFFSLSPSSLYKRTVSFHLPTGKSFTAEELLKKWNLIFTECGLSKKFKTNTQAVRWTKLHYHTTKRRGSEMLYHISKENPFGFKLIHYRPVEEGKLAMYIK